MLGQLDGAAIVPAEVRISAHTNRVAVSDGHTVCVSVEFVDEASPEAVSRCLAEFSPPDIVQGLPSTPKPAIIVRSEPDRPQPAKDRGTGGGMTTVVGRVRADPLFHSKFIVLSHNTIHGAAGGAILNGELLVAQGYLTRD